MISLLSIAITAHDRKRQLLNTLWTIEHTKRDYPIEVIIVDDDSPECVHDDELKYFTFPLTYHFRTGRTRQEPVVPNNLAFSLCKGDAVLMNCAEVAFMGDVIGSIFNYLDHANYLCFSTYSIGWELFDRINTLDWVNPDVISRVLKMLSPVRDLAEYQVTDKTGWYAHSRYKPLALMFSGALTMYNLERLSGYDERFIPGVGRADNDFLRRIEQLGLRTRWVDDPFVIHQPHEVTDYSDRQRLLYNADLFERMAALRTIKATDNTIFRR